MSLTQTEQEFLSTQRHGHLATVAPGGSPQVKPVGFTYNAELGTIDITGMNMASSAKYRNIRANPKVAFVVNEVLFEGIDGVRFLEIRGRAETVTGPAPADPHLAPEFIRIRPRRVLAFNLYPEQSRLQTRDIEPDGAPGNVA
jgi:pyridoxamine 5'-phosphate oxidase family protein